MNVWIVYAPLVVIVPHVDDVDTPSLPSVLYAIITTQFPHFHDAFAPYAPQPPAPSQSVPATHAQAPCAPLPHHHVPPLPLVTEPAPPPPQQYVTDVHVISFEVPLPPFVPTVFVEIFPPAVELPHQPAAHASYEALHELPPLLHWLPVPQFQVYVPQPQHHQFPHAPPEC